MYQYVRSSSDVLVVSAFLFSLVVLITTPQAQVWVQTKLLPHQRREHVCVQAQDHATFNSHKTNILLNDKLLDVVHSWVKLTAHADGVVL